MSILRKNTLVVDFSVLPKRPDAGEVEKFLEEKVKLKLEDTNNIQLHNLRNRVYIETIDTETALRYERDNYNKHSIVCNEKVFRIPIYVESEAVTVRVHDLPSHTPHLAVVDFMQQYGKVLSITRERWKYHFAGVYNGVRVLRMVLNRPIPSCVTIEGEATLVTYPNQPKTCNHCGKAAHPKRKCEKTTKITNTHQTTPQTATPNETRDLQLDGDMFPLLLPSTEKESNAEGGSPPTVTTGETEHQTENNNTDITSDEGGNCIGNDEGNHSSDTNEFVDAANQKRRILRRSSDKKISEMKKVCLSQGSQDMDKNCNRFQALVELDAVCPSNEEIEGYLNRSNSKSKNCKPSS